MTREEFIAKYKADFVGRITLSAQAYRDGLLGKFIVAECDWMTVWLGKLHDFLTEEIKNVQEQGRAGGKPGAAGGGGTPPAAGAPRNAA